MCARSGAAARATLLGFGGKAPAAWAAFGNGSLGHMLDYDDSFVGDGEAGQVHIGHVSVATIPATLALAEALGGVSGRELIAAVAAGTDLMCRIGLSIDTPDWQVSEGWFPTQLLGHLGGAAAADGSRSSIRKRWGTRSASPSTR